MSDIHCAACNEPWDRYGLMNGDVKAWEADCIKEGYGCPCCEAKGFDPSELYFKGRPELIGQCSICNKNITIDQDNFDYHKNIKRLIPNPKEFFSRLNDDLCCLECIEEMTTCDGCGKWINKENTYYIQEMNEERCEDCMDDITTCESCYQSDISYNMRFIDSKPYCSSCYGPDLEIQNESD